MILLVEAYARAVTCFWATYVNDELLSKWMGIYNGGKTEEEKALEQTPVARSVPPPPFWLR